MTDTLGFLCLSIEQVSVGEEQLETVRQFHRKLRELSEQTFEELRYIEKQRRELNQLRELHQLYAGVKEDDLTYATAAHQFELILSIFNLPTEQDLKDIREEHDLTQLQEFHEKIRRTAVLTRKQISANEGPKQTAARVMQQLLGTDGYTSMRKRERNTQAVYRDVQLASPLLPPHQFAEGDAVKLAKSIEKMRAALENDCQAAKESKPSNRVRR